MKMKYIIPMVLLAMILLSGCIGDTANLTVKVVDPQGNPLEDASIDVYANYSVSTSNNQIWRNFNGSLNASTQTDATGMATINLIPSKYEVSAWKNGYFSKRQEVQLNSDQEITIKMNELHTTKLTQRQGGSEYTVTQEVKEIMGEFVEFNFYPPIRFFEKQEGDYVYFGTDSIAYEIVEVKNNSFTFIQSDGETELELYDGFIENNQKAIVRTNDVGLYQFKIEYINWKSSNWLSIFFFFLQKL